MKVCFVILAHHQPKVFERLVRTIHIAESDVIVHVDKRANLEDFLGIASERIKFVTERRKVHWSGWSLTQAIMETLESALGLSAADYFVLLAGTDLPIRPMKDLINFLTAQYPKNYLNYYPLVSGIWGYQLVRRFHFNDLRGALVDIRKRDSAEVPALHRFVRTLLNKFEGGLYALLPDRNTSWIRFYSGAARWCLNRAAVSHAVECYRSPQYRRLRNHLRLSANSDEIFVQTVVLNSAHRDQCAGFCQTEADEIFAGKRQPLPDEKRLNLHYVDWSPEREDPAILVESDFDRIKNSGKFFAYKFFSERSQALMQRVERELIGME